MIRFAVIAAALALAGCQPVPAADACGAGGMQSLVGQPASVLAAMSFPAGTRIIEFGMPATADLNPQRLNILIGRSGLIERVSCG